MKRDLRNFPSENQRRCDSVASLNRATVVDDYPGAVDCGAVGRRITQKLELAKGEILILHRKSNYAA